MYVDDTQLCLSLDNYSSNNPAFKLIASAFGYVST